MPDGGSRFADGGDCMTTSPMSLGTARKILVRLPNWVGDVVMATGVLRRLREAAPQAEIVLEGRGFLRGLLAGLDSFDDFLPGPAKGFGAARKHAKLLRARGFDIAVLLPDSARAALPAALARIPVRVGYSRDLLRRTLVTIPLPPPREGRSRKAVPMPERYMAILRALGVEGDAAPAELAVDSAADAALAERLRAHGVDPEGKLLVVNPGASFGASKLYPPTQMAQAARHLAEREGLSVVMAPGPGEEGIARQVAAGLDDALVLDEPVTSLGELVALTARAALVLSNDTGPRHMAVALGRPVVTLMGPTDPEHTNYQLERQRVLREDVDCAPCHKKDCPIDHRCMTRLDPQRVVAAGRELLA